jgi:hypothetical protein
VDSNIDGTPNYMESPVPSPDPALKQITNQGEPQIMLPVIHANKIVWQDSRNHSKPTDRDIYTFTMSENYAPEISLPIPKFDPKIEEGESMKFTIVANDPETDELSYTWYLDNEHIPENDSKTLELETDFSMAGIHEVKVVISDGEYPIEYIWYLFVSETGIEPIEIITVNPTINPVIVEGEDVTFSVYAIYHKPSDINASWTGIEPVNGFIMFDKKSGLSNAHFHMTIGDIDSNMKYTSRVESNGSDNQRQIDITVEITDGSYTTSHTWLLTVLYYEDADMDGYNDDLEIEWGTDPQDPQSTPPDLDNDLILDADDDDVDGDGFLGEYDADDTNSEKQKDSNPDISVEILVIIISVVFLVCAIFLFSRVRRQYR